jgi:hypothetical protein
VVQRRLTELLDHSAGGRSAGSDDGS